MSSPYDFLSIYYPGASEIKSDRIQEMRSAVSTLVRSLTPDVDTAPNSPFGDLAVSPAAVELAAEEEAFNRFLSDLDPTNVENGVAWNCDFLRQFFLNFGIHDDSQQRSYGVLRLFFDSETEREIDRSTEFKVGDGIYRPFAPFAGPLHLLPYSQESEAGTNHRHYHRFSSDSWVVDILVTGNAGQVAVTAGTSVSIDRVIEGLSGATALVDFQGGVAPPQLQELARRIRSNFHTSTPTTRGGATNMIHQQFPEITLTGCTISGDFEQRRDVINPLQAATGRIDLLVRSEVLLQDTVSVRLKQMPGPDGSDHLVYAGWATLPETPISLVSFTNSGKIFTADVTSVSTDPYKPALTAAYGSAEKLWVSIDYQVDGEGQPTISNVTEGSETVAYFDVTYLFDPALKICQEFLSGEDCSPAGVDLYVKWFVPVVVDNLTVEFNRKSGTTLNLSSARSEIVTAYNSHRFEAPASPVAIDTALYYAGAHSVRTVALQATIRYSVAHRVWLRGEPELPTNADTWETFLEGCAAVPTLDVTSAYEPAFTNQDLSDGTLAVSGDRNVSYLLSSSNLHLVEIRSL